MSSCILRCKQSPWPKTSRSQQLLLGEGRKEDMFFPVVCVKLEYNAVAPHRLIDPTEPESGRPHGRLPQSDYL